jgi:hypothetical protein
MNWKLFPGAAQQAVTFDNYPTALAGANIALALSLQLSR